MLNNRAKEHFCIGFGSKILTHNFTEVDYPEPSMDQKCQLPIAAVIVSLNMNKRALNDANSEPIRLLKTQNS